MSFVLTSTRSGAARVYQSCGRRAQRIKYECVHVDNDYGLKQHAFTTTYFIQVSGIIEWGRDKDIAISISEEKINLFLRFVV